MAGASSEQRRVETLALVATALAAASDVTVVSEAMIGVLCPDFADACEVALQGQDGTVWRVAAGPGDASDRVRARVPDLDDHPLRRAIRGEFVFIDIDNDDDQRMFGPPDDPRSARALGIRSAVIAPLTSGDSTIGALAVAMGPSGRYFSEEDFQLVRVVAQLAGLAIDNLQSADLQRRVAARLRTAGAIGTLFAQAQEADEIADLLVHRAVEELGEHSGLVYLLEGDVLRLAAAYGHPSDRLEPWRSVPANSSTPAGDALGGELPSIWLERLDDVLSRYPSLGAVEGSDERSLAAVRLANGVTPVGAAFWTFDVARRFNDADRGFVELIADQAAAAIGRATATTEAATSLQQLLEIEQRQRTIAQTLQASLLPRFLPKIDGFDLHVEYWAALADTEVGGDFYDVFSLDDRRWGMVIGDVCGKGAAAAAVTATVRHSLRAAATHIRDEQRIVEWVHDAIISQADAPFCTIAYAVLDLSGQPTLRVVLAGHDKGIRIASDGVATDLGVHGSLLGIMRPSVSVHSSSLAAGDLIVFHTDGVTDAPPDEAMSREELVALLVKFRAEPLLDIGRHIRASLDTRRPSGDRDDTALLLFRVL